MDSNRTAKILTVLALAVSAALPLACGGEDDGASAPQSDVGEPVVATNDPGEDVVGGGEAAEGETGTGVSTGAPSLDILEEIDPALPSTLAEGRESCGSVDTVPDRGNLRQVDRSVICLLNAERDSRGLRALRTNSRLSRGALVPSRDMVRLQFFAHESPDGDQVEDRLMASRYIRRDRAFFVGENLGWAAGQLATPNAMVQAWMESPAHRANILHPRFREVGIGSVPGSPVSDADGATTFTTTFGVLTRARSSRRRR